MENEPLLTIYSCRQELVVIVPPGHPLADRDVIDLAETLPYEQVDFSANGLRADH